MNILNEHIIKISSKGAVDFDALYDQLKQQGQLNRRDLAGAIKQLQDAGEVVFWQNVVYGAKNLERKFGFVSPGAKSGVFLSADLPTLVLGANYFLKQDEPSIVNKKFLLPGQKVSALVLPAISSNEENSAGGNQPAASSGGVWVEGADESYNYTLSVLAQVSFSQQSTKATAKVILKPFELELELSEQVSEQIASSGEPNPQGSYIVCLQLEVQGHNIADIKLDKVVSAAGQEKFYAKAWQEMLAQGYGAIAQRYPQIKELNGTKAAGALNANDLKNWQLEVEDLRHKDFFTIDSIYTQDIDDAICVEIIDEHRTRVTVAIADASESVQRGSEVDVRARAQSFTHYVPRDVVHMMPETLSTNELSLHPAVDKRVLCAVLEFNTKNGISCDYSFKSALINSKTRYSYDDVDRILNSTPAVESIVALKSINTVDGNRENKNITKNISELEPEQYNKKVEKNIAEFHRVMKLREDLLKAQEGDSRDKNVASAAAKILKFTLEQRNSVDVKFEFNDNASEIVAITQDNSRQESVANKVVEWCMICANCAAAEFLWHNRPEVAFYRNQHPAIDSRQKAAFYSSENEGHSSLKATHYTHFTSPIRRYSDLIVHRIIKDCLSNPRVQSYQNQDLAQMGEYINTCSLVSRAVELKMSNFMTLKYLQDLRKSEFDNCEMCDISAHGAAFMIDECALEVFVPAFKLPSDIAQMCASVQAGGVSAQEVIDSYKAQEQKFHLKIDFIDCAFGKIQANVTGMQKNSIPTTSTGSRVKI